MTQHALRRAAPWILAVVAIAAMWAIVQMRHHQWNESRDPCYATVERDGYARCQYIEGR